VIRLDDPNDRRVCRVQITKAGQTLVDRVRAEIVAEYEAVLRAVPPESREAVIDALSHLLAAFKQRQGSVTKPCGNQKAGNDQPIRTDRRRSPKSRSA
jgi:hypothetical protein